MGIGCESWERSKTDAPPVTYESFALAGESREMASVAQFGDSAAPRARHPRARPSEPDGLTALRVLARADGERSLAQIIESGIIPRLMVAHAVPNDGGDADAGGVPIAADPIAADEIAALAPLALAVDADAVLAHVEAILARGVSIDTVLVDLLAPTARLLGEYWETDRCDFVDVTMGLWRLQEVVHEIAARTPAERVSAAGGYRALFASMPGDQHNFGTVVIEEVFRRNGWRTERAGDTQTPDLVRRVGEQWLDLVALTVSRDCHIAALPSVIVALRTVSQNPQVCIMVGGRIFSADPDLARRAGADGTAPDAKLALKVATQLVRARSAEAISGLV